MKAESFVFTGMQGPFTVFGLPPLALGLCLAMTGVVVGGSIAVGLMALSLPMGVVTLGAMWVAAFRLQRRDHHFANEILTAPQFWKKGPTRTLIAGHPPTSKKGRKR